MDDKAPQLPESALLIQTKPSVKKKTVMSNKGSVSGQLVRDLEEIEIAAFEDVYRAANTKDVDLCGIALAGIASAFVAIASRIDVLALNRVIGLGLREPATGDHIDSIIDRYRSAGVRRFFVQLHPQARPESLKEMLEERGFRHHNNWVKLSRNLDPPSPAKTSLHVRSIDSREANDFARIVSPAFDWPGIMQPWLTRIIDRPGWHHYMAYDGDKPVATGSFYIKNSHAWIDFAATLPECRGKGAQSALAERRIKDAAELGCRSLVVETAEQTPEHSAPSYRNMIKLGFEVAYVRPNYIYTFS